MWSKDPPLAPLKKPSKFYWFYDPSLKEMWPVEVWPKRYLDHFQGFWWSIPIDKPPVGVLSKLKR